MTPLKKAMGVGVVTAAVLVPSAIALVPSATADAGTGKVTSSSTCTTVPVPPIQATVGNVLRIRGLVQRCAVTSNGFTGTATNTPVSNLDVNNTTGAGSIWGTWNQANPDGATWVGTFKGRFQVTNPTTGAGTFSFRFTGVGSGSLKRLCIAGHTQGTGGSSGNTQSSSGHVFRCKEHHD